MPLAPQLSLIIMRLTLGGLLSKLFVKGYAVATNEQCARVRAGLASYLVCSLTSGGLVTHSRQLSLATWFLCRRLFFSLRGCCSRPPCLMRHDPESRTQCPSPRSHRSRSHSGGLCGLCGLFGLCGCGSPQRFTG